MSNQDHKLPAAVDAEGLPQLPKPAGTIYPGNYWTASAQVQVAGAGISNVYTTAQVEQIMRDAIAADRHKQAALTQMIELGQEIEADIEQQSIEPLIDIGWRMAETLNVIAGGLPSGSEAAVRRLTQEWIDAVPSHQSPGQEGETDGN